MDTSFFSFKIRCNKDLVIARQRARHIARLLNFERSEEAAIAAAVFALGRNCLAQAGRVTLHFQLRRQSLQVVPEVPPSDSIPIDASARWSTWRLEKPLPHGEAAMSGEDLAWALETMNEFAPTSLFDEIAQQNDDMLNLLRELAELRQKRVAAA